MSRPRPAGGRATGRCARLWRTVLRWLGFSRETRVHISAPGIEVVLTGEPHRVRLLLGVITDALDRSHRSVERPAERTVERSSIGHSRVPAVVEPSELDETDSPYALPPVEPVRRSALRRDQPEATYEIPGRNAERLRRRLSEGEAPTTRARPRAPSLALDEDVGETPTHWPGEPDFAEPTPMERTPVDAPDPAPDSAPDPERTAVELAPIAPPARVPELGDPSAETTIDGGETTREAPGPRSRGDSA